MGTWTSQGLHNMDADFHVDSVWQWYTYLYVPAAFPSVVADFKNDGMVLGLDFSSRTFIVRLCLVMSNNRQFCTLSVNNLTHDDKLCTPSVHNLSLVICYHRVKCTLITSSWNFSVVSIRFCGRPHCTIPSKPEFQLYPPLRTPQSTLRFSIISILGRDFKFFVLISLKTK